MKTARRPDGKSPTPAVGGITEVFDPPIPTDLQEVMRLFVIAAKVACEQPDKLGAVSARLGEACAELVPPEVFAARECARAWGRLQRTLRDLHKRPTDDAGRVFVAQLDEIGQSLDLPPLPDWQDVPSCLLAAQGEGQSSTEGGQSMGTVAGRLREIWPKSGNIKRRASTVAPVLVLLSPDERPELAARMLREGVLGRGEAALLMRWFAKGAPVGEHDTVLQEVLEKIGNRLVG